MTILVIGAVLSYWLTRNTKRKSNAVRCEPFDPNQVLLPFATTYTERYPDTLNWQGQPRRRAIGGHERHTAADGRQAAVYP